MCCCVQVQMRYLCLCVGGCVSIDGCVRHSGCVIVCQKHPQEMTKQAAKENLENLDEALSQNQAVLTRYMSLHSKFNVADCPVFKLSNT